MLIVLDTNIVAENWTFDKSYHRAFIDFISNVNCQVVFPQIVWSEIKAIYCSQLKDALNKQASANRNVKKHFISDVIPDEYKEDNRIDIDKSYDNYSSALLELLQCGEHSIIEYPEGILPILAEKAIARMKPFSNKGEEFRDAILWHSVLELAKEYEDLNPVIFISNNTNEFSDTIDKKELHHELKYELSLLKNRQVFYYSSMEEFIKAHKEPIADFNWSGIRKQMNENKINEMILIHIMERKSKVISHFERKYRDIIINSDSDKNQFSLSLDKYLYYSGEDIIYTYKNGDVSLFVDLDGLILFDTSYFIDPSDVSISKYDGINHRTINVNNFSSNYTTLKHRFNAQIEFVLKEKKLLSFNIISFVMKEIHPYRGFNTSIDDDDDMDLPF